MEWLGSQPDTWEVKPLGYSVDVLGGATPDKGNEAFWDGDIPWVSPKDMKRAKIADAEDHISASALLASPVSMIPVGATLVVVRGMILAHSFPVAMTLAPVTINQDMKALVPRPAIEPRFLYWVLAGMKEVFVSLADESAHGTRKLDSDVIKRLPLPVPSTLEQRAIADFLDRETARLDTLIDTKRQLIDRLRVQEPLADSRFVAWYLLSGPARAAMEADARGSSGSMVKLSQGHIRSWGVPLPPLREQEVIATYLNRETAEIGRLVATVEEAIDRLQEYRAALITAAVTGKIDVRGDVAAAYTAAAPLAKVAERIEVGGGEPQ